MTGPEVVDHLRSADTIDGIGRILRTAVYADVACDGATFVLRDGDNCFFADEDGIAPLWRGQRFPIRECISGWVIEHGEPAVMTDLDHDPRVPPAAYRPACVRSLAAVPIGSIAALGAYWAYPHPASGSELAILLHVAAQAQAAIERVGASSAPWAPNFRLNRPGERP